MFEPYQIIVMIMFAPVIIILITMMVIENKRVKEFESRQKKMREDLYEKLRKEGVDI